MNDPPDPGDIVPPAGKYVTIVSNESGMETDGSFTTRSRKRSRIHVCKQCNKKRRQGLDSRTDSHNNCQCTDLSPKQEYNSIKDKTPTPVVKELNTLVSNPDPTTTVSTPSPIPAPSPIGRLLYNETDISPYVVHVQKIQAAPNDGTSLHPVTFGHFLKTNCVQDIVNGSVKRIGRNKLSIAFSSHKSANSFLSNQNLEAHKMKAFIPTFNVTRMGLVRGVPVEWSPEEILENISVPIGCGKIIKVRRINFKIIQDGSAIWKPSQSIVVTFDGQVLPKRIFMCFNALPVDLYIFPTIQCFNCCRFGHTKTQCRSKPRCFKCGDNHSGDSCNREENYDAFCCSCEGSHFATSKSCPEYNRQQEIKNYMAHNCTSYAEASKCFPSVSKLYSKVTAKNLSSTVSKSNQSVQNNIINNRPESVSYKKTVFLKPRSPPKVSEGYDTEAHNNILREYDIPSPNNGCGYSQTEKELDSKNISLPELIKLILNLLTCFISNNNSNNNSPSNVASIISNFIQILQNGQSG